MGKSISEEIRYRSLIFGIVEKRLVERFDIDLGNRKAKVRKDRAHDLLLGGSLSRKGNWRVRKLVNEKLTSLGMQHYIQCGVRYFVGMKEKANVTNS